MAVWRTRRPVRALVFFVLIEAAAIVAAYLVQLASGGYGAVIAEAVANALAAYWLSASALAERWPRSLAWATMAVLLSFLPVAWLVWKASLGPPSAAAV